MVAAEDQVGTGRLRTPPTLPRTVVTHISREVQTLEGLEMTMSNESRRVAGILLIGDPKYMENPLRQDLWRAGHAHAGVWLILALVALRYVDGPTSRTP